MGVGGVWPRKRAAKGAAKRVAMSRAPLVQGLGKLARSWVYLWEAWPLCLCVCGWVWSGCQFRDGTVPMSRRVGRGGRKITRRRRNKGAETHRQGIRDNGEHKGMCGGGWEWVWHAKTKGTRQRDEGLASSFSRLSPRPFSNVFVVPTFTSSQGVH